MQIEVRPRKVSYTPALEERAQRHFGKIGKRVPDSTVLHLDIYEEVIHGDRFSAVAEASLLVRGSTLHAKDSDAEMGAAIEKAAQMLSKQLDKYLAKHQHRNHHSHREREEKEALRQGLAEAG